MLRQMDIQVNKKQHSLSRVKFKNEVLLGFPCWRFRALRVRVLLGRSCCYR